MNKLWKSCIKISLLFIFYTSYLPTAWSYQPDILRMSKDRLIYHSDQEGNRIIDYSHAGYHSGQKNFPHVPVKITLKPVKGDNATQIQKAINQIARLPKDKNGHRGAILLKKGRYSVTKRITIHSDGIVIKGEGRHSTNGTVIISNSKNQMKQYGIISVRPSTINSGIIEGSKQNIISPYIPAGSRTLEVRDGSAFQVNDDIIIKQEATHRWLMAVNYGNTEGDNSRWAPGNRALRITLEGRIIAKDGNKIKLDTPLYHELNRSLAQATIEKIDHSLKVEECGIENLRVISKNRGGNDESHPWQCIFFDGTRNCWAKNVTTEGFAEAGFIFKNSSRSTVLNCSAINPVSKIEGGRRYNFFAYTNVHDILFKRCQASHGRHSFIQNGAAETNGIVFTQSKSKNDYSASEIHRRWGQGVLFDAIEWSSPRTSTVLGMYNRGSSGTAHGWTGNGQVAWNLKSPHAGIYCSKPPIGQNFAIGCQVKSISSPRYTKGHVEGTNKIPTVKSLYEQQLKDRLNHGIPVDAPARLSTTYYRNHRNNPYVDLKWLDIALDEIRYLIQRKKAGDATFKNIAFLPKNSTSYRDEDVENNQTYTYRIRALNVKIGHSAFSNKLEVNLKRTFREPAEQIQPLVLTDPKGGSRLEHSLPDHTGKFYLRMGLNNASAEISDININKPGEYKIYFRYSSDRNHNFSFKINNDPQASIKLNNTRGERQWKVSSGISVNFQKGLNNIKFIKTTSGKLNIDYVKYQLIKEIKPLPVESQSTPLAIASTTKKSAQESSASVNEAIQQSTVSLLASDETGTELSSILIDIDNRPNQTLTDIINYSETDKSYISDRQSSFSIDQFTTPPNQVDRFYFEYLGNYSDISDNKATFNFKGLHGTFTLSLYAESNGVTQQIDQVNIEAVSPGTTQFSTKVNGQDVLEGQTLPDHVNSLEVYFYGVTPKIANIYLSEDSKLNLTEDTLITKSNFDSPYEALLSLQEVDISKLDTIFIQYNIINNSNISSSSSFSNWISHSIKLNKSQK